MSASTQSFHWPQHGDAGQHPYMRKQHINEYCLSELASCREALINHYQRTRQNSVAFSEPLSAEDQMLQSMVEASPNKWHLAHTTWFFETFILKPHKKAYQALDERYEVLFNSYYNRVGKQHLRSKRGLLSRPSLDQVMEYRHYVDLAMMQWLESTPANELANTAFLVALGINHEEQHQELMVTDLLHGFSYNSMAPAICKATPKQENPGSMSWATFNGGQAQHGYAGTGFHFDNEGPRHTIWLHDFQVANRPITNAEFLSFIEDGGYDNPLLWIADGWHWRQNKKIKAPLYWQQEDGQWLRHTLAGKVSLDPHAPLCHISWFEAMAFAQWFGARLPTEFEWEYVCTQQNTDFSNGNGFSDNGFYEPLAASSTTNIQAPVQQLAGHVWEWTSSAYGAYPGFQPFAGDAGEYNGKFMANQFILKGGSCATPRGHARASYRNFFYPQDRWQFSGIRLAKDAA